MKQSTLDAIRRLAERPGTEHEGTVARAMLAKQEGKPLIRDDDYEAAYRRFARKEISMDEFIAAMQKRHWPVEVPRTWECACGEHLTIGQKCHQWKRHGEIQAQIRDKFKVKDRVFYNYWAYRPNDPGYVAAYVKPQKENGSYPWGWLSIRFDRLKSARQVPIISAKGWHLSLEPLGADERARLNLP